ncbi:MAG TPA: MarR family transcriptional regulator [Geomonas sp.]|nr:MarR family transcriptional regulator [Geomonas sp.]
MTFEVEQTVAFALSKASQSIWALFREEFQAYGITPPQYILLAILWKSDSMSRAELAKRCRMDRTTLGGILDRLAGAGFVERGPSPEAPRANRVRLSEKGRALFEQEFNRAAQRVRRRIEQRLVPAEYKQLTELLSKLLMAGEPMSGRHTNLISLVFNE